MLYIHFYVLAKLVLFFKKPYIVLFLWSENKSFLREKFKNQAVKSWFDIWEKQRPYNTCFAITLTILDLPSAYGDVAGWFGIYFMSFFKFIKALFKYPKYLFLEAGIDQKWEAKTFMWLLKPKVVVFGSLDHSFSDDTEILNIVEKELWVFVSYLNTKADGYPSIQKEGTLEEIVSLIKNSERYFGVIDTKNERIKNIWDKIIRKLYLK